MGGGSSTATIGPEGGEITSADGKLTLTFPPGALSEDTEITIRRIDPEDLPPEFSGLGPEFAYLLEPDGIEFAVPVTATLMLDEEPVQDDGSLETDLVVLITSSNGQLEVLDNLTQEVNGDTIITTTSGELSHFSPLVTQDSLVTGVINGVPDSLPVGGSFNAVATVVVSKPHTFLSAGYFDRSNPPVTPQFNSIPLPHIPSIIDDDNQQLNQDSFPYICSPEGTGLYRVTISIINIVLRFRKPGLGETDIELLGTKLTFPKGVTCAAVTPTPTPQPSPSPSPGPSPSPSPSPSPTPQACMIMAGSLYKGDGGCGVNIVSIRTITGVGNLVLSRFGEQGPSANPGDLSFEKTDDPKVFNSVKKDLIIFGEPGHSCTLRLCDPTDNQATLECTMPGAVCQEVFTLQQ